MQMTILAKKCVCSYLSLLVNSKDDLALANILNVPDRGLDREAFTSLKHVSQERKMSIFLVRVMKLAVDQKKLKTSMNINYCVYLMQD